MGTAQSTRQFASPKVAQRIASRSGEEPVAVTVKLVGRQDVRNLISGINQAQKSSQEKSMSLD